MYELILNYSKITQKLKQNTIHNYFIFHTISRVKTIKKTKYTYQKSIKMTQKEIHQNHKHINNPNNRKMAKQTK